MRVIVFHNANPAHALPERKVFSKANGRGNVSSNAQHLEHFDKNEDLGILEADNPSTRNTRYDSIYDRLSRKRVVIAHFEFDLKLSRTVST